jgi:signal transduction histidine kinase
VAAPGCSELRFDADVEACVYFCCLQAIQNVIRHAGNAPCTVRLRHDAGTLAFSIDDEGDGFDTTAVPPGMGLRIVQDRVDALEGELTVASTVGQGTHVEARIPARPLEGALL